MSRIGYCYDEIEGGKAPCTQVEMPHCHNKHPKHDMCTMATHILYALLGIGSFVMMVLITIHFFRTLYFEPLWIFILQIIHTVIAGGLLAAVFLLSPLMHHGDNGPFGHKQSLFDLSWRTEDNLRKLRSAGAAFIAYAAAMFLIVYFFGHFGFTDVEDEATFIATLGTAATFRQAIANAGVVYHMTVAITGIIYLIATVALTFGVGSWYRTSGISRTM